MTDLKKYKSKGENVDFAITNMMDQEIFKKCLKLVIGKNEDKK